MFNNLDDIYEGTDEDVIKELEDMGIDIQEAKKHFTKAMEEIKKMRGNRINEEMAEQLAKDDMDVDYPCEITISERLDNCPFCGKDYSVLVQVNGGFYVKCHACLASGPFSQIGTIFSEESCFNAKNEAARIWDSVSALVNKK